MATHSSILAWRIPWIEEPGRLQSMGSQRVRYNWSDLAHMLQCLLVYRLLLLLLSHFSRVRLCVTPQTAAHQAPLSLGFSRQERWSGLPLPSPMHESEEWKWSRSVMSDSSRPHGLQPTRFLHPWEFPGKSTGVGRHRLLLFTGYWKSNRICILLLCTNYINLNYVELVHGAFQV